MSRLIKDWSQSKFQHMSVIITVRTKSRVLNLSQELIKGEWYLKGSEYCRLIAGKKESYMAGKNVFQQA
ncbi:putative conjugative transfer protein TraA [Orientia chuto str. Dubai]|uniref:Putative conjugative transfer protein TraA n=1 Tax=Orientia chuto str. Dubai TaxID=1359168 RepID=A0A0F3MH79_9RICK|nr:hypothetical protein [Candidatus Orientia mediorientalis]KJV55103.1 putative conjugative transfer protein TraA [Orientia chuto str. Dubai]